MENSCRTCLRENRRTKNMKLLSTKWNNSTLSFADMLMDIVKINKEITSDETLLKICSSCELDLITAYNFKIVCEKTEKILFERYKEEITTRSPIDEVKCEIIVQETPIDTNETGSNSNENIEDFNPDFNDGGYDNNLDILDFYDKEKIDIATEKKTVINDDQNKIAKKSRTKKKSSDNNADEAILSENTEKPTSTKAKKKRSKPKVKTSEKKKKPKKQGILCKKCNVRFEIERDYRRHCEEIHFETFPCTICGKLYLQNRIKTHMITHLTEKNYNCSICDSKFASSSKLKEHMRMHSGEKRYKCKYCDEAFIYWTSRKNHIYKAHTREKKYECHLCHNLFAQSGQLARHIKYHIGDLKYPCSICNKSFITPYAVKRHELTHSKKGRDRVSTNTNVDGTRLIEDSIH